VADLTIVLGNKNYSSWSLRAWLALRATGLGFAEVVIPLDRPDTKARLLEHSPAARVPVLHHGDLTVWDSLAICEYLAELAPSAGLWPSSGRARATARSLVAEMHSGFAALRAGMPMNCRASRPDVARGPEVAADIRRIVDIWRGARSAFGERGPYLFGGFTIPDAFFAPVASRFVTYGVRPADDVAASYMDALWQTPWLREWVEAARAEPWTLPGEEL
jgi:glutathione S-transferase